jgi:hypothetical protein
VGKASRQRRLKKEKERQQRRMARAGAGGERPPSASSWFGDVPPPRHGRPYEKPPRPAPPRELAQQLVAAAVSARAHGTDDDFSRAAARLADQPQVPSWPLVAGRALRDNMVSLVAAAWRGGWQPTELVRHAGRELGGTQARMMTDVIADEMRGYAAATVDGHWMAQLTLLGAEVWWGQDEYLGRWRDRAGTGQIEAATTAVDLLLLLSRLPVLERLGPLPGTARPSRASHPASAADERILDKIRALLAKAESTEFAEEAEALSTRAQMLMAKYSIDRALLAAKSGGKDEPVGRRLPVDNPYEAAKASLLQYVATANRCRPVWHRNLGLSTVVGFAGDVDAVELLFTSLLVQANAAMLREGSRRDRYGRSRTRAFRQSFLIAYAVRIGERLSEAAGQAERQAAAEASGRNLLPVLASRQQAVDDAVDEIFGDSITDSRSTRATDAEGWYSGRAAADMAALDGHREVSASP